jgi:branched-subunit amino acid aminotransferase/4-amino-4-deoxychorismate lyase
VTTPPLSTGALPGITRAICLERLADQGVPAGEGPVPLADLRHVDELFLTNSVAEIVPVVDVDGLAIGDGAPGPITRCLAGAYRALVRAETGRQDRGT